MDIEFNPETHRYLLNGRDAPSVTTVLDAEGLAGCGYWKEEHRKRGTAVHDIVLLLSEKISGATVEEIVANSRWEPSLTSPVLVPYGMAAAQYFLDSGLKPELVEHVVGSTQLQLCGKLDVYGKQPNGKRVLIDFKSGQPQSAADIQTALYAFMLEECMGLGTDERACVWLKPDGTYKAYPPRPPGGNDLTIGKAAVWLYHWREQNGMLG